MKSLNDYFKVNNIKLADLTNSYIKMDVNDGKLFITGTKDEIEVDNDCMPIGSTSFITKNYDNNVSDFINEKQAKLMLYLGINMSALKTGNMLNIILSHKEFMPIIIGNKITDYISNIDHEVTDENLILRKNIDTEYKFIWMVNALIYQKKNSNKIYDINISNLEINDRLIAKSMKDHPNERIDNACVTFNDCIFNIENEKNKIFSKSCKVMYINCK